MGTTLKIYDGSKYIWALDAGHGSNTKGKCSPVWSDGDQLIEWEYTRKIRNKIIQLLDYYKISYFIVNPEDKDISLRKRVKRINNINSKYGNVITVSIHGNAAGVESASGYEVFTSPGQTPSDPLADIFFKKAEESGEFRMRRDKTDGDNDKESRFTILTETNGPALLTESGFYTNRKECKEMLTDDFVNNVAVMHIEAILEIENK